MVYDVAIIGAGAAGLAAARRLKYAPLRTIVLEARDRIGGRAHTVTPADNLPLDLGCEWLHSADRNPLAMVAKELGLTIDTASPRWGEQAGHRGFPAEDQRAYQKALDDFEWRIEQAAARNQDAPASQYFEPGSRWNALLNAFSSYYNGAPFDRVSILDYSAFEDSGMNWRVTEGLGTLIAALGGGCDVALQSEVTQIDHSGPLVRLDTAKGAIEARTAIVTLPTSLIALERPRFVPALADKTSAAADLPLGLADKVFLGIGKPDLLPENGHALGRIDRAETGSYQLRPSGQPYVECFFGGDFARSLEREGPDAFAAVAIEELCNLFGHELRAVLKPLVTTAWDLDAFSRGAYSHAKPGRREARALLAQSVDNRLFFAGEACSSHSFSTAHGAYETGVKAAESVLAACRKG